MYEKVNSSHPDKLADRIAGALVDVAYSKEYNPKIAVEVLIGHNKCLIISESSVHIPTYQVESIVRRIIGDSECECDIEYKEVSQDVKLAQNQATEIRCGDNGIFKGIPTTTEQKELTSIVRELYSSYPYDGKYIINNNTIIACQSNIVGVSDFMNKYKDKYNITINPLGDWTGGIDVDSGATNRKLGSDMGDAVTGGGTNGKDMSKADVSVNIYCHLLAQELNREVVAYCAIGDKYVIVDDKKNTLC